MILLIDNFDSFVYNLARYFVRLGHPARVVRNTAIDPDGVLRMQPDAVVLSPGPCAPRQAGCSLDVVRQLQGRLPILGVCLGHQTIAEALGGRIVQAASPLHGQGTMIHHDRRGVFHEIPDPFLAGRYHSLVVEPASVPDCLEVSAWAPDGAIMALRHRTLPIVGLQFHPESIITEHGYALLANFLRDAHLSVPSQPPRIDMEYAQGV